MSIRRRDGFNRMVADALDGKIDLIITKSLSLFARNTVDALTTILSLKAAEVAVYFQKKDFYTEEMPINTRFTAFFEKGWCLFGV